jgi:predicted enzyme related to lactoylglutathione lyase
VEAVTGFRPVAVNVGVRDLEEAIRFYEAVFGAPLEVSPSRDHARWVFGEGESFFLFNLRRRDPGDPHRDHVSAFGFGVSDLDATHARAVAAGGVEHFPPIEEAGMPRHSRFEDPSGNRIVLWGA